MIKPIFKKAYFLRFFFFKKADFLSAARLDFPSKYFLRNSTSDWSFAKRLSRPSLRKVLRDFVEVVVWVAA